MSLQVVQANQSKFKQASPNVGTILQALDQNSRGYTVPEPSFAAPQGTEPVLQGAHFNQQQRQNGVQNWSIARLLNRGWPAHTMTNTAGVKYTVPAYNGMGWPLANHAWPIQQPQYPTFEKLRPV